MKWKINDKIQSYDQLYDILENYLDDWSEIEQFKTNYDEFVGNLKKLKELNIIVGKDLSKPEKDLKKQKKELNDRFNSVLKLLRLYADDNKKKNLEKKVEKIRGNFDKLSGNVLGRNIKEICAYTDKKLNPDIKKEKGLGGYGINTGMINGLRSACEIYLEKWEILNDETKKIKESGKEIKKIIIQNDVIIKNRIKKFMSIFKRSDPEFYKDFVAALKMVKNQDVKPEAKTSSDAPGKTE